MINGTFRNINRLLVLSFKIGDIGPIRNYFDKCFMLLVEIKEFNALIDNKPFFDQPVKNKDEAHEKRRNVQKQWHHNRIFIRLFIPPKFLSIHWHQFIKTGEYNHSSTN